MANFTINSLSRTSVSLTDSFIKSDENGALTRATIAEIAQAVLDGYTVNHAYYAFGYESAPTTGNSVEFDVTGITNYTFLRVKICNNVDGTGFTGYYDIPVKEFVDGWDGYSFGNIPCINNNAIVGLANIKKISNTRIQVKNVSGTLANYIAIFGIN